MDFEIGVVVVGLAGKERLDLAASHHRARAARSPPPPPSTIDWSPSASPSSISPILSSSSRSARLDRGDGIVEVLPLAHDGLRLLGPVPEVGALDARVQLRETALGDIPVKDASGSARPRRGFRRRAPRSRLACSNLQRRVSRMEEARRSQSRASPSEKWEPDRRLVKTAGAGRNGPVRLGRDGRRNAHRVLVADDRIGGRRRGSRLERLEDDVGVAGLRAEPGAAVDRDQVDARRNLELFRRLRP